MSRTAVTDGGVEGGMEGRMEGWAQRRSQVSLVGGADRIPGGADIIPGGGINLNTSTYKMSRRAA